MIINLRSPQNKAFLKLGNYTLKCTTITITPKALSSVFLFVYWQSFKISDIKFIKYFFTYLNHPELLKHSYTDINNVLFWKNTETVMFTFN